MTNGGLSANNAGPSAMRLYANAGSENTPANTGEAMGAALYEHDLSARTHYARPTVPGVTELQNNDPNIRADYNLGSEAYPVKYDVPSHYKEHFQAKEDLLAGIQQGTGEAVQRVATVGEDEVQYLQSMKKQAELADFDRYVHTLIDPRKPGNLKWLMEIYPEYVNRRIQQVHTDYEFALRNQMIDSWGINTFDDLHFKYLVDQGKVDGPRLERRRETADEYAPGLLSPWVFQHKPAGGNLRLPFASALIGKRPDQGNPDNWALRSSGQPFTRGRGPRDMATSMYNRNGDIDPIFNTRRAETGREVVGRPDAV